MILINNKLTSNFKEKANHSMITLPNTTNSISNISLSSIKFKDQDILKIIHSLNNKAMVLMIYL